MYNIQACFLETGREQAAYMGHFTSLFAAGLQCTIWIILPQTILGNMTSVRLVDGSSSCSGRVQVLHLDVWGTVCNEDWDLVDANIVCRQLGCGEAQGVKPAAYFGKSSEQIWMNNVKCVGNESSLTECPANKFVQITCLPGSFAGVICKGNIRLVSGIDSCSGRVEVLYNGTWGTVCDDGWDLTDAAVVCREMGCGDAIEAKGVAYFGKGSGQIWMDDVNCIGDEQALNKCGFLEWGGNDCLHSEDAGVICQSLIRLVQKIDTCTGIVEVFHNGSWGKVCGEDWDQPEAAVVCGEIGCGELTVVKHYYFTGAVPKQTWMGDVNCIGAETQLSTCPFEGWGPFACSVKFAGVVCALPVRLVDGYSTCSGRVEVFYEGQWGTVHDNGWDLTDATVVCQELGCGSALVAPIGAYFGKGTGPIWMNFVDCFGDEPTLMQCDSRWHPSVAEHLKDAGVICSESSSSSGSTIQDSGPSVKVLLRIEVKIDSRFDPNDPRNLIKFSEGMGKWLQMFRPAWKTQPNGKVFQNVVQKKTAAKTCN